MNKNTETHRIVKMNTVIKPYFISQEDFDFVMRSDFGNNLEIKDKKNGMRLINGAFISKDLEFFVNDNRWRKNNENIHK